MAKLDIIRDADQHEFLLPSKRINDGEDVNFFLTSTAYMDIMKFLLQLDIAMFPVAGTSRPTSWPLGSEEVQFSPAVQKLQTLVARLDAVIEEAPPDPGPRRFGNISFRKWYEIVSGRMDDLLDELLPEAIQPVMQKHPTAKGELQAYLLGSFGSAQRLDYGTGHELSFLAFLGCIWKLGGFAESETGNEERGIVLGVIEQYLRLIRRLILTYTLEPAGSHGVWGLDDHSFLPYIFGSAQLSPPVVEKRDVPTEGSLDGAPNPGDVVKKLIVERERKTNMYFSAIGFIYDVKKGPFWEHSPILFDVSGVRAGWAKINKGMIKMYNAEVLSKFPVVQHFPFGSIFRWEKNPEAAEIPHSIHTFSQPQRPSASISAGQIPTRAPMQEGTRAPWAANPAQQTVPLGNTPAPWAANVPSGPVAQSGIGHVMTGAPWATSAREGSSSSGVVTGAPWASSGSSAPSREQTVMPATKAPWAGKAPHPGKG